MRYLQFQATNFKGIQELSLPLDNPPRSNVITLVGLNESGKTTVLEAISAFAYGAEDLPIERYGYAKPDVHDLIPVARRSNFNDAIVIRAKILVEETDRKALASHLRREHDCRLSHISNVISVKLSYEFQNSKLAKTGRSWTMSIEGRVGQQRKDRELTGSVWQSAAKFLGERMPRIWYFPNFLFEFPDRIYLRDAETVTKDEVQKNAFYRSVIQDILDCLDENTSVEEHLVARITSGDPNDKRALDQLLLRMGRDVTRRVFEAWNTMLHRQIRVNHIRIEMSIDEAGLPYVSFKIEDADGYFAISERSLGFRWFFVYLLLTTYRTFRRSGGSGESSIVLLLDEPASNLHSTAQEQLLKSFGELSQRCMILYTTHSRYLINPRWLESTFVVKNVGLEYRGEDDAFNAQQTNIEVARYREFAAQQPSQTTYFQPILDLLDYRPAQLELVPAVVITEGKNDFYVLSFASLCFDGAWMPVVPAGGAGGLLPLMSLYIGWARDFVALLDSDDEANDQRARYIDELGPIVAPHIITLEDVDAGFAGKAAEYLFTEEDRLKIQQGAYPEDGKYQKKRFYRALQELVAAGTRIELSPTTQQRLSKLLIALKACLSDEK